MDNESGHDQPKAKTLMQPPRLLWIVLGAVFGALVVGVVAVIVFANLAGGTAWPLGGAKPPDIDSSTWYDVTRSAIATIGLAGLGGGAVIAYRRQQTTERRQTLEEGRNELERQRHELERERHQLEVDKRADSDTATLRDRYAKAAEQLGHSKAAVRLAGVYAIAALADDWGQAGEIRQQRVCVNLLCAYIRMPYDPQTHEAGEREVRLAILEMMRNRLQDPDDVLSWCHLPFNFRGATFDGGSLRGASFKARVSFRDARFTNDFSFYDVSFDCEAVLFANAEFASGMVDFDNVKAEGSSILFNGAKITGGQINFRQWQSDGAIISFDGAQLEGGAINFHVMKFGAHFLILYTNFASFTAGSWIFDTCLFYPGTNLSVKTNSDSAFSGGSLSFASCRFLGGEVDLRDVTAAGSFTLEFLRGQIWHEPPLVSWTEGDCPEWVRPTMWPPSSQPLSERDEKAIAKFNERLRAGHTWTDAGRA